MKLKAMIFPPDTVIFKEGSQGNQMGLIVSGKVKVFKSINGDEILLGKLGKNEFIGEMSLFSGNPRSASVATLEETHIAIFTIEDYLAKVKESPDFSCLLIRELARRLTVTHRIIEHLEGVKKSYELIYGKQDNKGIELDS